MSLWMTSFSVSIQIKATEQCFPGVLFIMLYTVVLVIMKQKNKKQNKTNGPCLISKSCHHATTPFSRSWIVSISVLVLFVFVVLLQSESATKLSRHCP